MTVVQKDYRFDGPDGEVSDRRPVRRLRPADHPARHVRSRLGHDLPRLQCLAGTTAKGVLAQLRTRDLLLAAVSRAPAAKIAALKAAKGWPVDWYSSFGSDFNYDFQVTIDPSVAPRRSTTTSRWR